MDCSHSQFANVWMQLEDAYRAEHGYGGNIAEVYLYLMQPFSPGIDKLPVGVPKPGSIFYSEYLDREEEAVKTLYEICRMFAKKREAEIFWETSADDFHKLYWHPDDDSWFSKLAHRIHIRVVPK